MRFSILLLTLCLLYMQASSFDLHDPQDDFKINGYDGRGQLPVEQDLANDIPEDDPVSFLGRKKGKGRKGCGTKCSKGQSCVKQCGLTCGPRRRNDEKGCDYNHCNTTDDCCTSSPECQNAFPDLCLEGRCGKDCVKPGENCTYEGECCKKDQDGKKFIIFCPDEGSTLPRQCSICKGPGAECNTSEECCLERYQGLCMKGADGKKTCGCQPEANGFCESSNFGCCFKKGIRTYCDDKKHQCISCVPERKSCKKTEDCCGHPLIKCDEKTKKCTAPACVPGGGRCNSTESLYCCKHNSYCVNDTCVPCKGKSNNNNCDPANKNKDCCGDPLKPFCDAEEKKCVCAPKGAGCSEDPYNCCDTTPADATAGTPELDLFCRYGTCTECVGEDGNCTTLKCCQYKSDKKEDKRELTCEDNVCKFKYFEGGECADSNDCVTKKCSNEETKEEKGQCVKCTSPGGDCKEDKECCGKGSLCKSGQCRPNKC